jgi:opacity protein-like surface antigen
MWKMSWMIGAVTGLLAVGATAAAAQSRQSWSLQVSGEAVLARYTFGRFSVGGGYQRTVVFKSAAAALTGTLSVGFIEPRYVVAVVGDRLAPYLAARVGYGALLIRDTPSVTQNSFTYGAGLGVLVAVVPHVAIDLGGQYFVADFGGNGGTAGYFLVRAGLAVGLF